MKKQYLHLVAYRCDKCSGPFVAASLAVRQNEISKETEICQVGEICLACGNKQCMATELNAVRHFPPIEWESTNGVDVAHIYTAFVETLDRARGPFITAEMSLPDIPRARDGADVR